MKMNYSAHPPIIRLTTKLLVLQVSILILTVITTILISLAYTQDAKWVEKEKPKFKSKYEVYYNNHIHIIDHKSISANNNSLSNRNIIIKPPRTSFGNKPSKIDCDVVKKHEHSKIKKKPPHEHGHTFSPRFEETMITNIFCNAIVLIGSSVNLGLCLYCHSSTYRRIINGSIHLVGCWFLLLSINIGIGQMINVDADYQNNNTNITNDWIYHDFIGCSISYKGIWKEISKISIENNKSIKPTCENVQEYFYHNKSGIHKYDYYLHRNDSKIEHVYTIKDFNRLEDYAYTTGLCQLWTHKLSAIILNFIALICAIEVVRSAFKAYRPGELDAGEVLELERSAFIEVWVDESIDNDELYELTRIIEKQELRDTKLQDFNLELREHETDDEAQGEGESRVRRPERYSGAYRSPSGHRYYVHMRKASSASALSILSGRSNSTVGQPSEATPGTEGAGAAGQTVSDTAIQMAALARRKSSLGTRKFRVRRTAELERFLNSLQHTTETLPSKAFH